MDLQIREITQDNFVEAVRLEVTPDQKSFVASNAASIAQSKFHTFLECYGIYGGDRMVGFSACGANPEDGTIWIARHMVGAEFQGRGYGRAGLRGIVAHLRAEHGPVPIFLDVAPANARAAALYESEGFRDTGRVQGESKVYRLDPPAQADLPSVLERRDRLPLSSTR